MSKDEQLDLPRHRSPWVGYHTQSGIHRVFLNTKPESEGFVELLDRALGWGRQYYDVAPQLNCPTCGLLTKPMQFKYSYSILDSFLTSIPSPQIEALTKAAAELQAEVSKYSPGTRRDLIANIYSPLSFSGIDEKRGREQEESQPKSRAQARKEKKRQREIDQLIEREHETWKPLRILLASPVSEYAIVRARTLKDDDERDPKLRSKAVDDVDEAFYQAGVGLAHLYEGLTGEKLGSEVPSDFREKFIWLANQLRELEDEKCFSLKFYHKSNPSGPMYFFRDVLLSGRFPMKKDSVNEPWIVIIDDPTTFEDMYDIYRREFLNIWHDGSVSFDSLDLDERPADIAFPEWKPQLTSASKRSCIAHVLRVSFRNIKQIRAFIREVFGPTFEDEIDEVNNKAKLCLAVAIKIERHEFAKIDEFVRALREQTRISSSEYAELSRWLEIG